MKIKLPNGATIEGTQEQVTRTMRSLGVDPNPSLYYNSSTHGLMLISDMDTNHLRNAVLKMVREWTSGLYSISDPDEFVDAVTSGIVDVTFIAMLRELKGREAF